MGKNRGRYWGEPPGAGGRHLPRVPAPGTLLSFNKFDEGWGIESRLVIIIIRDAVEDELVA